LENERFARVEQRMQSAKRMRTRSIRAALAIKGAERCVSAFAVSKLFSTVNRQSVNRSSPCATSTHKHRISKRTAISHSPADLPDRVKPISSAKHGALSYNAHSHVLANPSAQPCSTISPWLSQHAQQEEPLAVCPSLRQRTMRRLRSQLCQVSRCLH